MPDFPEQFVERLARILPEESFNYFINENNPKVFSFRVNSLKTNANTILCNLPSFDIGQAAFCEELLVFPEEVLEYTVVSKWIEEGFLYRQSLSSVAVGVVLDAKSNERILDLCAAPGSKTSQIAAMMENTGEIIAVEPIKNRFYKLKSVLELLGVTNTTVKFVDGRRFRDGEGFDRILVDVPCSTEARFRLDDPDTFAYWSVRKIKEMQHKQKGLLLNAYRLLRPKGTLVYSTCSFAPEENEGVIDWFLRKTNDEPIIETIDLNKVISYSPILKWEKKIFNPKVKNCFRILPTPKMEGFFITKIRKP